MTPNPFSPLSPEYRAWASGYDAGRRDRSQSSEWRQVAGSAGYEISDNGDLRRVSTKDNRPPRAIQGSVDKGGYRRYFIRYAGGGAKNVPAHRLVCEAFIGRRPSELHFVAHGDGNRLNNDISNLRWATISENEADKELHGTRAIGEMHGRAKLRENDALAILESNESARDVATQFNVCATTVRDIRGGRSWKHIKRSKVSCEGDPLLRKTA